MKTKKYLLITAVVVIAMVLIYSTISSRPQIIKTNPAFVKYISAFTSGMISRKSTIRIELARSINEKNIIAQTTDSVAQTTIPETTNGVETVSALTLPDSSLLDDIFNFEPNIKGHAIWISDRIIEFIPDEELPSNQFFNAEFNLKQIIDVECDFETFNFQFSIYPQSLSVVIDGLRSYNDYNIEWQKLTGSIKTSDFADTATIKKVLKVTQNGKEIPVIINPSYYDNTFYFYVDSIERKNKPGRIVVTWDGESINSNTSGSREIEVKALGDFSVTNSKVVDDGDQYIELTFSDPLDYNQNLKGIVTLQGIENLTYAIENNVVKIFLPNRIQGEKMISITNGIKNFKGYKMNIAYSEKLYFEEPNPMVRIKGKGSILPNSNGLIFPFEAIYLKAVDVRIIKIYANNVHQFLQVNDLDGQSQLTRVGKQIIEKKIDLGKDKKINLKQWNTFVIDLGKLISPDPGAIYRVSIKFTKKYALCDCPAEENEENENAEITESLEDKNWNENGWDYWGFDDGYDSWDYYYDDNASPCDNGYYYGKAVSRNILASDLGLIYKLDENKTSHAFVNNMITTQPVAGATIEYYDYTKQLIASGITNGNGILDLKLNRKPFLMVAKYGKQRGYLKLLDGYANSLSKFDIEGEVVQKGVKGFIYGERGVWRPGDSLYINFILEDKEKRLPANHPVKFELQDPEGTVICQTTKTKNLNGLYDFRTATSPDANTGNYLAYVTVGNRVFNKVLKIETVKPNRLKIYLDFDKEKNNDTTAKLSVKWLHGAIAKNLNAMISVSVSQTKTSFDKYTAYEFDSPIRKFSSNTEAIFDGKLNEKGEATIKTKLNIGQVAPGMLRTTYTTKVFEEGGDFSIDRYSTTYSPYKNYVGLYTPVAKNYDNTLEVGNKYKFEVVTVDNKGNLVNTGKLQVKVYKIQWRWWYEKDEEDLAQYISRAGTIVIKDTLIKLTDGKGAFKFGINYPEYGRYLITVTDLTGGHQTGKLIYIDWPYWSRANRSTNENANMLNFACDKENYTTGQNIKLSIPSPANGMALVSVETGTKVVKKFWIPTKKGETIYEFPATPEMAPNAYLHVTLLQPHANTINDLPIRMYGVVPIIVDDPLTHLNPEIKMPDVIKPETSTTIRIKEKNGRKMTYTLAIVDDGLLDLTRFSTPQPWTTFNAREALGVKTWDMYDFVIGAYAGKLDKLLSIGGDGDGLNGKGLKANRFKPMVTFIGPFTLNAGQEKSHKIQIPNYVGSVRVMVVAENNGTYGNAEKTVAVRKPLMVLATLPRVLGPGETVALPVNIFAMEKHVKDVKIDVEVNEMFTIEGSKQQIMHFNEIGDDVINFKLNTVQKVGIARVKITATSGKEKAYQEIEIDIRTPNPKVVDGFDMVLEPGKEWNTDINFKGIEGTNKATIELSSIPAMSLEKRLDYLIQYPHGCIEQTTSSVFPQLFVSNLIELTDKRKDQISFNIKAALKRLQLFQTANGGFSYWPGEGTDSEWGTNYAGHFVIEAEKQGYNLPINMKAKWVKYQQEKARNWSNVTPAYSGPHGGETNENMQAYRLFVLAMANTPELGAMNRLLEEKKLSASAKWRLAAAYKIIGQKEVALKLIEGLPTTVVAYKELSYSYGSDIRDKAMILESLSLLQEKTKAWPVAKEIAASLSSQLWMNTQETAYCLLAMCEYTGAKNNCEINFSYSLNGSANNDKNTKKTIYQIKYNEKDFAKSANFTVKNNGQTTLFAKLIVEGTPLIGDKTAAAKDLKMEVKYQDMSGNLIQLDKIVQGTDFVAVVTITNPGTKGYLQEMVLNQIFPSGWEIHNTRMDETGATNPARYQDIRDDRVYSYYNLNQNATKTFEIQLNATYLGRFYLPTVYSEAMYDNTINARIPGRWVEVVKEEITAKK
ncbi:MAG: hypothetical protein HY951_12215 [Bacteroidia bacterium]|nr:hypothetical protein [Bacteroidia bacterium]